MQQTVERLGRPAAPGIAAGPLFLFDRVTRRRQPTGEVSRELSDLDAAIAGSIAQIRGIAAKMNGAAADILEFQIAMLEDDALVAPARARIDAGIDAATAWSEVVQAEIAGYEGAADEYFRARVADLRDLHDEVHRRLSG